jgi:hypothetical protein
MSAFICSKLHIQTIAQNFVDILKFGDVLSISNELHKENIKSVNYRYDEKTKCIKWKNVETLPVSKIQLYKLIKCLEYQSCEHNNWKNSKSYLMLQCMKSVIENGTNIDSDEYDNAKWTI